MSDLDRLADDYNAMRRERDAQWADLERIASLCGRTADEHPLQAVARVVRERDEARDERDFCRKALDSSASAHERDLIAIWRVLGNYHEPPSSSEAVIDAVQLMRDALRMVADEIERGEHER